MTVTEANLRNLPEGASYTAHDGALTLEARREGEIFHITARSDSLSRRIEYYETTSARQSRQVDSLEKCLNEVREAYNRISESISSKQIHTINKTTHFSSHRVWWVLFGIILGTLGSWWAHKTNFLRKLIKFF